MDLEQVESCTGAMTEGRGTPDGKASLVAGGPLLHRPVQPLLLENILPMPTKVSRMRSISEFGG